MHHHRLIIYTLNGLAITGVLLFGSCAGSKKTTTSTTTQGSSYSEDLSVWRPKVEVPAATSEKTNSGTENKKPAYVEPKLAVNKPLEQVLDSISKINLSKKYVEGFAIQVFAGKREEALNAKKQISLSLPGLLCEVQFTEPIFRVKVGRYYTHRAGRLCGSKKNLSGCHHCA